MADDLRALFSSNDASSFDTDEAFTNRDHQWSVAAAAVEEHLRRISDRAFSVEDLERPRTNVVVFHGVGGVGKSTLLRKLEAALATDAARPPQWGARAWTRRLLPIRIDLARSASTGADFERVILTVRLALAGALGRPLPSFDLALRQYWEATHPGEPLDEYIRRTGLTGKFSAMLPQQMQSAVSEIAGALELPGMVGSAAGQVASALVKALRSRREHALALAGASRTAALLEATPDLEALSYYPHLLAWDLSRLPAKQSMVPVVLLDTWEDTADRHRDLERLLQRLVWLMPTCSSSSAAATACSGPTPRCTASSTGPAPPPGRGLDIPPQGAASPAPAAAGAASTCIGDLVRPRTATPISPAAWSTTASRSSARTSAPSSPPAPRACPCTWTSPSPASWRSAAPAAPAQPPTSTTPSPPFGPRPVRPDSDERHVLRSWHLLDAFDLDLATQAAGPTHQAPARRLVDRPLVADNPYATVAPSSARRDPYGGPGRRRHSEDRWTPTEWHQAAARALEALGGQWTRAASLGPSRMLLVACLRQGLRLARDHRLTAPGWLTDAAFAYTSDSVWEPLSPPAPAGPDGTDPGLATPADALAELLTAIGRRQREHRARTIERLTTVLDTGLLPAELTELALYYRAKAYKDLDRTAEARAGMRQVADINGRLAPQAHRGLANLARLSGDFPTALAAVPALGWAGRHHRVLGDIHWPHGNIDQAVAAFAAARAEAEQHDAAGERAMTQVRLAFALSFTDPVRAEDELTLAHQLLDGLDQRANTLLAEIAAVIKDAGSDPTVVDRARALHADATAAGLPYLIRYLELGLALHHAVRGATDELAATIGRLHELTDSGDFGFFTDIAYFMAELPLPEPGAQVRWLDGETAVRERWHALVAARRAYLSSSPS